MDVDGTTRTVHVDTPDALFAGNGEMGRVMAGRDWAATPLGPPQDWPASLRSAVRILLTSRFAMWMAWGPDLTMLYNDAYRRDTLRAKHPWALGQPASAVWAEIWDDIGPRIASVLQHGTATWDEDLLLFLERSGYPEETYHTFSYSPLSDDEGAVAGMLCVVTEETDRVLSERRMATLRELASDLGGGHGERQVLDAVGSRLAENPRDLPFTLTYLFDDDCRASLAVRTGVEADHPLAASDAWPVSELRAGRSLVVDGLRERFGSLPTGAWPQPPTEAVAVPLAQAGQAGTTGFVVAGLNPYRPFDERYRGFVDLLASQVAAGLAGARAYDAERRRAEGLAALDRAKTEFFTNISHEFRTPLTLIMGPVAELRAAPVIKTDDRLRAELDVVHRNALRLGKLVNALLDYSRLQAGRARARFEPVDLPGCTAELASVFRSAMERAGLEFTLDCPPATGPTYVDRDMWEKIVLNLLSNALKFTLSGHVRVALRTDGGRCVLTVADTGTGVPAEELPRLFERFHRVARARARSGEGSGIGLATVREIVALHGGTITAESVPGKGTTFTVSIPLGRAHLPADQVVEEPSGHGVSEAAGPFLAEALRWLPSGGDDVPATDAAEPSPPGPADPADPARPRVLVADDNADMRDYLCRLLAPRYAVELVGDGDQALAAALAEPPDLLVSDVMMPGLHGMALVAALRSDPRTAHVPVMLLSARAGQEAAVEGLAAGADDYLVKPFTAAELLARVDGHVRLSRARGDAERQFRTLADATPTMVWAEGPRGQRVFVNRAWSQFVGDSPDADADPDADLGQRWRERIHPDDRARYAEVREACAGKQFEIEYRLRDGDGRHRWVLDRGAPIGSAGYVGGCLDIDTRYRERERQRILAAVGAALDRETRLARRRDALVRTLVEEKLVDVARLVAVDDGKPRVVAAAGPDAATERLLADLDPDWTMVRSVLDSGEAIQLDVDEDYVEHITDPHQRELRRRLDMRSITFVPLTTRGRTAGTLVMNRARRSPAHDAEDLALLVEIGRRAATALDNAQLYEREQDTSRRLALLQRATAALSAAATPAQVAQVATTEFERLLGAPAVGLWELHVDRLEAVTVPGWATRIVHEWSSLPRDAAVPVCDAVRRREPVWVETAADWARDYRHLHRMVSDHGYVTVGALPLVAAGTTLGAIVVAFTAEYVLDADQHAAAGSLADQCAQAYQRASLLAAESAARRAAEEFAEIVSALSRATTPDEVTAVILDHAAELGAATAAVLLRHGDHLDLLAGRGTVATGEAERHLALDAGHPVARAVRTGEAVWYDARATRVGQGSRLGTSEVDLPTHVALPLLLGDSAIGAIALDFDADHAVLTADERAAVVTIAGQCAQALARARLHQAEHEVADTLQRSLLPLELPALARLDSAARYLPGAPGSQTGGDWYDLLPLSDTRAALVVGDVVGQGPGAAAVMGQLRSALAGYLLEGHGPAAALELLDSFADRIPGARGSTCACVIIDWELCEARCARAGHPPVLLLDGDGPRLFDGGAGTVLGVPGRPPYAQASVPVAPGASVVLYTDGLVERRGEVLDDGLQRLVDAAGGHTGSAPAQLVARLLTAAGPAQGTHDDIAVIAARVVPAPLRDRVPALPTTLAGIRRAVHAWAEAAALDQQLLDDLQLALGEATANAVEHAYPGHPVGDGAPPELEYEVARRADGGVSVRVRDFGTWRPPPADPGFRGRGMALLRRLAADVVVDPGPRGTTVRFVLAPARPGTADSPVATPRRPPVPSAGLSTDGSRVRVCGDVDPPAAAALRADLLAHLAAARAAKAPLVVDLDGVTHLASAGVGLLLELVDRAHADDVELQLRATPGTVAARVLALTGVATP